MPEQNTGCTNCGNKNHSRGKCTEPEISLGIIIPKLHGDVVEFLIISKK